MAKKWHDSEEYKPIRKIREENSEGNAIIIEGVVSSESNMGEAIKSLEQSTRLAPFDNLTWDYAGEARQFKNQSSALMITFLVSIVIIYLSTLSVFL